MGFYYKLLNFYEGKYTTHETLEEVHHYIAHCVKDMQYNYKVTDKLIRTEHSNYDFHYVTVEDDIGYRYFVYFFDTIEEELDSRNDDEVKEQRDRAIDLLNQKTTALFNANRTIEFLRKQIFDSERSEHSEKIKSNLIYGMTATETEKYYKEVLKSKEHRIDTLEAEKQKLIHEIRDIERENADLDRALSQRDKILEQIRDVIYPF